MLCKSFPSLLRSAFRPSSFHYRTHNASLISLIRRKIVLRALSPNRKLHPLESPFTKARKYFTANSETEQTAVQVADQQAELSPSEKIANEALQLWSDGDLEGATSMLKTFLNMVQQPNSPSHIEVLRNLHTYIHLGTLLMSQGRLSEAEKVYTTIIDASELQIQRWFDAISKAEKEITESPTPTEEEDPRQNQIQQWQFSILELRPVVATCYHDLGKAQDFLGDALNAQVSYAKSIDLLQIADPENHMLLGTFQSDFGMLYENIGNYKVAERYHLAALRANPHVERYDHPHLATMLNRLHFLKDTPERKLKLESILDKLDPEWQKKEEQYHDREALVNLLTSSTPPVEPEIASSTSTANEMLPNTGSNQGEMYSEDEYVAEYTDMLRNQFEADLRLIETMYQHHTRNLGHSHMALLPLMLQLSVIERQLERYDVSRQWLNLSLQMVAEIKGNLAEAEVNCRSAVTLKEDILGSDHIHVGILKYDLGYLLGKRDLHKESMYYYAEAYENFRKNLYDDHSWTKSAQYVHLKGQSLVTEQQILDTKSRLHGTNLK